MARRLLTRTIKKPFDSYVGKIFKKSRTYKVWFFSYLMILLLPIGFTLFQYRHTQEVLTNEVIQLNFVNLKNTQSNIDSAISQIKNVLSLISGNHNINKRLSRSDFVAPDMYEMYETAREISAYNSTVDIIKEIYVYLPKSNLVLTSHNAVKNADEFFLLDGRDLDIKIDDWKMLLASTQSKMIPNMTMLDNKSKQVECMAFLYSFPSFSAGEDEDAVIVTIIENRALAFDLDNNRLYKEGSFFLFNESGENIVRFGNTEKYPIELVEKLGDADSVNTTFNGENIYILQLHSNLSKWRQVAILPTASSFSSIYQTRTISIFVFVFSGVMGMLLILCLLRYNYTPLSTLIHNVSKFSKSEEYKDEYSLVNHVLNNTVREKEEISHLLDAQKKEMRIHLFRRMLKNEVDDNLYANSFELYDINFEFDCFFVLIVRFDDVGLLFRNDETMTDKERVGYAQSIVSNVLEEMMNARALAYMLPFEDMAVGIVNIASEHLSIWKEALKEIVIEAQAFVEDNFEFYFSVAVSNVQGSCTGIPRAYAEALTALEYMVLLVDDTMMFCDDIPSRSNTFYYPIDVENKLLNSMKTGDDQTANLLIDEVFRRNFKDNTISAGLARCFIIDIESTIIKGVHELLDTADSGILDEIMSIETLVYNERLKEKIQDIIRKICEQVRLGVGKDNKYVVVKMKKFIDENYTNPDLSISVIAEHVGLNPTYATTVFKKHMGNAILNYLTHQRVEAAKILLARPDITIEEISNKVGYMYWRTFTRMFKKTVGVSPSEYRENALRE